MNENTISHQLDGVAKPIAQSLDRMNTMAQDGVAKVVDSSHQLKELAQKNPQNLEQLSKIYGIGETKLEKFGRDILQVLSNNI